ncbi:hypothetical protein HYFRA_00008442 [Hymenoscyphus fraxineus]|uniref:Uncharacterized protein n=1 Tax=Hymenoscyphus fraxineus TaxID=746836 RepID=A0A9N9KQD9_9HELO|nr:hypothetical protein HYFRA_00008442 [Hymenoscyphus fraxineus]
MFNPTLPITFLFLALASAQDGLSSYGFRLTNCSTSATWNATTGRVFYFDNIDAPLTASKPTFNTTIPNFVTWNVADKIVKVNDRFFSFSMADDLSAKAGDVVGRAQYWDIPTEQCGGGRLGYSILDCARGDDSVVTEGGAETCESTYVCKKTDRAVCTDTPPKGIS